MPQESGDEDEAGIGVGIESGAEATATRQQTIEALDEAIGRLAARMDAACYEQLVLIRAFDERAGWLDWAFDNCSDWLAWRCDISLSAAREKVRVAHALLPLPNISQAFAEGRLSYTKVRALTRVSHLRAEGELLRFALKHTALQVEERCREFKCGTVASTDAANRAHDRRYLSLRRHPDSGTMSLTLEVPLEYAAIIDAALDRARESLGEDRAGQPELADDSWSARQADAFLALVQGWLAGDVGGAGTPVRHSRPLVTVHVDRSALVDGRGRSGLPIETLRRLACDAHTVTIVEDENELPLSVGRQSRTVPKRLMQALWARDQGCRFPGCRRQRYVDAHHVKHWAKGGESSLDNLLLLCTRHHRAVHEGGYVIRKDFQDQWRFVRPDGIAVPACGYRPDDEHREHAGRSLARIIRSIERPSARGILAMRKNSAYVDLDGAAPGSCRDKSLTGDRISASAIDT